jgi:hypothetical protein
LAAIQDGQVVVAEGKVIANSILAEAVTAEKIKAGAIESDKIASNFILDISGERAINIGTGGTFTVESNNFNIDDEGNVTLVGTITAEDGKIGGWTIDSDKLYAGSDDLGNYVALSTAGDSNGYTIWAGNSDPGKADFAVKRDGSVYLDSVYV